MSERIHTHSPFKGNNALSSEWPNGMDYMQELFPFPHTHQSQMYYQAALPYQPYMIHPQQQFDDYYLRYGNDDYVDLLAAAPMQDEFGDMEEISTRPRLTKQQVEILESQFQANHKPNSQVKRQLALQTNLKFQRVGNWFQNRRAKAKQQKRQEDFEAQNGPSKSESTETPTTSPSRAASASPTRSIASPRKETTPAGPGPASPVKATNGSKEASWASLQRALTQAKAAQAAQHPMQTNVSMPPPELPSQGISMQLPIRLNGHQPRLSTSSMSAWPAQSANPPYPSPIMLQDNTFDFGFDEEAVIDSSNHDTSDPVADFIHESFVVTPEDWQEPLATPKGLSNQQNDLATGLPSPGLTMPSYPNSRRQSTVDDRSCNPGRLMLASSPPNIVARRRPSEPIQSPSGGQLDIAARRKRPRPAALTSASLRSRSYGAMTSVSPTFRPGVMTPQMPQTIRHVKSAGHSLNARYAGIRKASSAQRSPMCVASFAEAEAFHQLMAQQAVNAQGLTDLPAPLLSPDIISNTQMTDPEKNPFFTHGLDMCNPYSMPGAQNLTMHTASPPITPLPADFMVRGLSQQSLVVPASAPPQFASFPDYTPPYSAGPLTNSSWSDAAITSPELSSFPPVTYVPSLGYPQAGDGVTGPLQQFVLASDHKSDVTFDPQMDHKKTEFYIQEFPNQREEHAHVAQQLSQQKPKNYVFANSAPNDYTAE